MPYNLCSQIELEPNFSRVEFDVEHDFEISFELRCQVLEVQLNISNWKLETQTRVIGG